MYVFFFFGFLQGGRNQEKGCSEDRGAADEAGGPGNWPWREQADRTRDFQAQLFGPTHFCGLVSSRLTNTQHGSALKLLLHSTEPVCFRCKKWGVPIEKIYNKTQREKFAWAIDMADEDYEF